ncbi:MAG TPA: carbamoyltransferase HypF [Desulfomonilaceae bacterium]|nr:carbamoyltransferase HypF [Desulfomonilaceae bacterium]
MQNVEHSIGDPSGSETRIRQHIILTGILQGIGFRPTVYRLATRLGLGGWVINSSSGVHIEIEGTPVQCQRFAADLPATIPFPGRVYRSLSSEVAPLGETSFRIETSLGGERSITPIPPDVAVCPECLGELFDTTDPRYLYPFITCTLCGPRFTVVRSFPYDRERTSMADFVMCPRCQDEYDAPGDRRFHSETNSCPDCGPRLKLLAKNGETLGGDPVVEGVRLLMQGRVLAIKGIGGFHLACNALDESAVALLRDRKGRAEKPFAVMMPDLDMVGRFCKVSIEEARLLTSPVAPIVLMDTQGERLAPNVAPFVGTLGVMLPYSPLHHLLFKHPDIPLSDRPIALVMTSGNRSEEPIVRGNREAIERLGDLVDAFILHDREIVLRADDSIFRVIGGRATVFRHSRGLVPGELALPTESAGSPRGGSIVAQENSGFNRMVADDPVVLAAGGDLKNSLAIIKGNQAVPGPHVGDLASPVAQRYFKRSIEVLTGYLDVVPSLVAVDPHPEYFSNSLVREMKLPVEEVFHHHAHAVSLLVQHELNGPCIFAVFDGTGFGTDGGIWGGEFLVADLESFTREAHIGLFPLPGGEAAIREPVRILAALLSRNGTVPKASLPLLEEYSDRVSLWLEAVEKKLNCPLTSSAGRLFDAAAAAVGFRRNVTFEGQAAMWLEGIADKSEPGEYKITYSQSDPILVDPAALIRETAEDIINGTSPEKAAARFHNSMARLIADIVVTLVQKTGINTVGLTGGCFQNRLLTERTLELLESQGLEVLLHESVPPNDGGLALGQAVTARERHLKSC